MRQQDPLTVWTLVDGDDGDMYLISGLHFVPDQFDVRVGETIRFVVTNPTDLPHELFIGTMPEQVAHHQHREGQREVGDGVELAALEQRLEQLVDHARHPAPWPETADVLLERREVREFVRSSIDQLPESYRVVLLLRDIEELDTSEAAALPGVRIERQRPQRLSP